MTRDKQFDLLESLNNLDDDILIAYTASRASRTAGASETAGQRAKTTRERNSSPWVLAACLCLFAALVYVAILMTAGGGWDRIAAAFGWERETTKGTEYEPERFSDPTEKTEARTEVPTEAPTEVPTDSSETGTAGSETQPGDTTGTDVPGTDPTQGGETYPGYTSAHAFTGNDVTTHMPCTDFFVGKTHEDSGKEQTFTTGSVLQNENFAFYTSSPICALTKRNLKTLEETPVCCDPYCSHEMISYINGSPEDVCPFNNVTSVLFLYQNKVYYVRSYTKDIDTDGAAEWHDVFASYDYVTGEYRAIEDKKMFYNKRLEDWVTPKHEKYQRFGSYFVYGSAAYSIQYRPIYGKGDSAQDYGRVLVRLDLETDKSTDLMPVDNVLPDDGGIMYIRGKTVYYLNSEALWAWKPEEGTLRRLTVIDTTYTLWYVNGYYAVSGDYLYTMTYHYPDGYDEDKIFFTECPLTCLLRINLNTGEPEQLTDVCPDRFFLRDGKIYVVPEKGYMQKTEFWQLNVNPWKESTRVHKKYMRHILKMDLDGGNAETIGYCNSDDLGAGYLLLTENGLLGSGGFFEFSTGITYNKSGNIQDDPANGIIWEPPIPDIERKDGWTPAGEEAWW